MRSKRRVFKALDIVVGLTALSSVLVLLNATGVYAESDAIDTVTVTVPVSCSITNTVDTTHTATVEVGTYTEDIGETIFKVLCNDSNGFAVYAIGYSDDTYGNTVMKPSTLADTNAIATGTATSGSTSNWAMKLTAVSGDYTPALATGFNDYHAVPAEYTKVASLDSSTDATVGSSFKSTYAAFVSQAQPADTYVGKVKYTVVHPSDAATPLVTYTMQDVESWGSFVAEGQEVLGIDARDGKSYTVARLADGNLWMTQNLDLDLDSTKTYTPADTDISANWTPSQSTYSNNNSAWSVSTTTPESYDAGERYWNGELCEQESCQFTDLTNTSGNPHNSIGNYYNWTAAVALNDSSDYNDGNVLIDQSICPAGWTLPRAGYGDDSYYSLLAEYGLATHSTVGDDAIWSGPLHFIPTGLYSGHYGVFGSEGGYWTGVSGGYSQNFGGVLSAYVMFFDTNSTSPGIFNPNRSFGGSIRCVARPATNIVTFEEPPKTISNLQYMQDLNNLTADDKTSVLASMEDNTTYDLIDTRDNRTYQVAKLKDGNIWMAENLDLGRTSLTTDLTSSNTNLNTTVTASTFNSWRKTSGTNTYTAGEFISVSGMDATSGTPYGTLYNYYVASAGTIAGTSNSSDASYDICPAGWRLPTGGSTGEFQALYTEYNSNALMRASIKNAGAAFALAGLFGNNTPVVQGTNGRYWSSTRRNNTVMHLLVLDTSDVSPKDYNARSAGYAIRCVAK